jgi:hypothetical protein
MIENPMVIDSLWRHLEDHRTVIGECAGCEEDIYSNEQWYEVGNEEGTIVHQSDDCCRQYIAEMSFCRGGEE